MLATLVAALGHFVPMAILITLALAMTCVSHVPIVPVGHVSMAIDLAPARHCLCPLRPLCVDHAISLSSRAIMREVTRAMTLEAVSVRGAAIYSLVIHSHGPVLREGRGRPGTPASAGSEASSPTSWGPLRQRGHAAPAIVHCLKNRIFMK